MSPSSGIAKNAMASSASRNAGHGNERSMPRSDLVAIGTRPREMR